MVTQKLGVVGFLDNYEVACCDEDVVACLDKGMAVCLNNINKNYFGVDFLHIFLRKPWVGSL